MKSYNLLIIGSILTLGCFIAYFLNYLPEIPFNFTLESALVILVSIISLGVIRTSIKGNISINNLQNSYKYPKDSWNKHLHFYSKVNWKTLIPFLPVLIMALFLLIKPYYLFPTSGDLDFHLVRAREILQSPFYGLFWDYMVYYPTGRALWHPPLFHGVLATLWYLGGVRFAHSVMCLAQVLLSVGVASWFANKKYGAYAGLLAGFFVLCCPRSDTLVVLMPATFIPIIALLTIYYLPQDGKKSVLLTITAIWTHMIGFLLIFLFLVNEKGRSYLKNWKLSLPLLISLLFWLSYWIVFSGQTGASNHVSPSLTLYSYGNTPGLTFLLCFGIIGFYFLYKDNLEDFKLFSTYISMVLVVQFLFGDISRGLQYVALPLAVLSSLGIWKLYKHFSQNMSRLTPYFLAAIIFLTVLSSSSFTVSLYNVHYGWGEINIPFEKEYTPLDVYLKENTGKEDVIWAESSIADKVAWTSGHRVSNGKYGSPPQFISQKQNINIYKSDDYFIIKNQNQANISIYY